jgi:signal peptidase I
VIDQPPASPPATSSRRAFGCLLEIVETLVLTAILFWLIQSFVAQPFQVRQQSMMDTIQDSQFVLVDRLTPRFDSYHRGDIIVFTPPEVTAESPKLDPFIKRVIGVAGDTVELRDGAVYVNGIALDEPYVFKSRGVAQPTIPESGESSWTIADGELFVMGDHRAASSDSRAFGPIKVSDVIGRAWLRYWPLAAVSILPTDSHPELASPSPGPSASTRPSPRPSVKPPPKPKPTRTPRP